MAYGPVNVPGTDLESIVSAVKAALMESIRNGELVIASKPVFPIVDTDIENPKPGEAWISTGGAG